MDEVLLNGTGPLGRMVFHLLDADPRYRVRAFTAPARYCTEPTLFGAPVIAHEEIADVVPPGEARCLSVLGGLGGWEARRAHYATMVQLGYSHTEYIHPTAVIQGPRDWGDNIIVFPYATIGYGGRMGDDNVIREKVYLGHDHRVGSHVFLGVGATIGGGCTVGSGAYVAMESTVSNDLSIGDGAFIGIGSLVLKDAAAHTRSFGRPARAVPSPAEDG